MRGSPAGLERSAFSRGARQCVLLCTLIISLFISPAESHAELDCNGNNKLDLCEVAPHRFPLLCFLACHNGGCPRSPDCNNNYVPDGCDVQAQLPPLVAADRCGDAPEITPLPIGEAYEGSTLGARPEGASFSCRTPGSNGSPNVYYAYTPAEDGEATIDLCGSEFDTLLSVHATCPALPIGELACNNDSSCGKQSKTKVQVKAGWTYYIRISGTRPQEKGSFKLRLSGPRAIDTSNDCDGNLVPDECQTDTDQNSVPDVCEASCSDPLDSDFDGLGDSCEACPFDPFKSAPGACGCGVSDADSDNDGSLDCADQCPLDPAKLAPGSCGCGTPDTDSDNDGSFDCIDSCPNDPLKTAPLSCGCGQSELDSDQDSTPDCLDLCTNDANKTAPGSCGCGTADSNADFDGVLDCLDACPSDPLKIAPLTCGCGNLETDSDADGTPNCNDLCPLDSQKLAPGTCGCGNSDFDLDFDGTPNCRDLCPGDPLKTAPLSCGCGALETDSDSDGVPNCVDQCSSDPLKTAPGSCGCGTPETDTDGDGRADCRDLCPLDPEKIRPLECGCDVPDSDENADGILDCFCSGSCDAANPLADDDDDGVSNCQELLDETRACDKGSYSAKLKPSACGAVNAFLAQTNIVSIVNHRGTTLTAEVRYLDSSGVLRGSVAVAIPAYLKSDLMVNELGLLRDSYGTVCVLTSAVEAGAWSGGISIYKQHFAANGQVQSNLDFAAYYPFMNPLKGVHMSSLNTFAPGAALNSTVANWIRLIDAIRSDGLGLTGTLAYYNGNGTLVGQTAVSIPDGGGFDFAAHDAIGPQQIGSVHFTPSSTLAEYYFLTTRYVYDGAVGPFANFHTGFAIPNRPATGAPLSGRITALSNELSVLEILNSKPENTMVSIRFFTMEGTESHQETIELPPFGVAHRIVGNDTLPANSIGSAEVVGGHESVSAIAVMYQFNTNGQLELGYAPPLLESPGRTQVTDFNTYLDHGNILELMNTTDSTINAQVQVVDYGNNGFTFNISLEARAASLTTLPPPLDSYGTVIVSSGSSKGLVVLNTIQRSNAYVLPISGR